MFPLGTLKSTFPMAERPIFVPAPDSTELVREIFLPLRWHSGFAPVQKEKNIDALHEVARQRGLTPLLEVSTKSKSERGRHMDRKSTRLNSSHLGISYAVFCLKK